jgi:hypothetical protein
VKAQCHVAWGAMSYPDDAVASSGGRGGVPPSPGAPKHGGSHVASAQVHVAG